MDNAEEVCYCLVVGVPIAHALCVLNILDLSYTTLISSLSDMEEQLVLLLNTLIKDTASRRSHLE